MGALRHYRVLDILLLCGLGALLVLLTQRMDTLLGLQPRSQTSPDVIRGRELSAGIERVTVPSTPAQVVDRSEVERLRQSRVALSRELNRVKQEMGQLSCKMRELKQGAHAVAASGGWCLQSSRPDSRQHAFDADLCQALSRFLQGKTVASFGDGPGAYKRRMDALGQVLRFDAFDGAPFVENVTSHQVHFLDLTAPQFGLDLYDWVISLEVAEHIPGRFEAVYLDNVWRHASQGIILSWARPNQKGHHHVNTKSPEEVIAVMRNGGFAVDTEVGERLRRQAKLPWFRSNLMVFRRDGTRAARLLDV